MENILSCFVVVFSVKFFFAHPQCRNTKEIDKDTFKSNVLMFVLAGPRDQFTEDEFKYIKVSVFSSFVDGN